MRTMDAEAIWPELASLLDFQVAFRSPQRVFVHAGVVAWHDQAILIPGRSHSGKTTLVKALVEAGATYYSDEYAVLDGRGRVHPYPRPLNVRQPHGEKGTPTPIEAIGGDVGQRSLRVGWVVDTHYSSDSAWRPKRLSTSETFLKLWDNTVIAMKRPRQALPIIRRAALRANGVRSKRGEAEEAADKLLSMIARS